MEEKKKRYFERVIRWKRTENFESNFYKRTFKLYYATSVLLCETSERVKWNKIIVDTI